MNENGTNGDLPINEAPIPTGEGVAERYVETELHRAKTSLLRTQIGSVLAVLILGGYTMYLTSRFRTSLEPKEAATIAQGVVSQKLDDQGVQLADYVKKEVPAYIRQAPDYAMKQLPEFRAQIEQRVNSSVETYAKQSSEQLSTQIDKFLEDNKESVGTLLKNGQDPEATAKLTSELKGVFMKYLDEAPTGGESVKSKLDQALDILNKVEGRMKRLATAKDLTPAEANAKRAIAVLTKTIHEKRMEEGHEDAIAPKASVQNAANTAVNAAGR